MPHQMQEIGHGRVDTLKHLPAGNNWKRVMADANEVRISVENELHREISRWKTTSYKQSPLPPICPCGGLRLELFNDGFF